MTEQGIEVETQSITRTYQRKDVVCKTSFLRIVIQVSPPSSCVFAGRLHSRCGALILLPGAHRSEQGTLKESKFSGPQEVRSVVGLKAAGGGEQLLSEKLLASSHCCHIRWVPGTID